MKIKITQGLEAIIDDADYPIISKYKWFTVRAPHTTYARTNLYVNGIRRSVGMHRVIMGMPDCSIDHINHNGLDNRRHNLRMCSHKQNQYNRIKYPTSQYKGVFARKTKSGIVYLAVAKLNQKRHYAGTFATPVEAARAYDKKACELFGEFAYVNFPNELLIAI
jgi:hypothetical protein